MTAPPPDDPGTLRPLDLAQPKDVGALITSAWRVWTARPGVFLAIAVMIGFIPFAALGTLRVYFEHADNTTAELAVQFTQSVVSSTVIIWVISATHARAVVALAAGDDITRGEAIQQGVAVLGRVAWVAVLGGLAILGGLFLLLFGAVWIAVLVMFAVPIAAVTDLRGWSAVRESWRLVRAVGWWRTLGNSILISVVGYVITLAPAIVFGIVAGAISTASANADAVADYSLQIVLAVVQTVILSWTALATTLLYFSHRARTREPWELPPGSAPAIDLVRCGPEPVGGTPTFARPGHVAPAPGESQGPRFDPPSRR